MASIALAKVLSVGIGDTEAGRIHIESYRAICLGDGRQTAEVIGE